MILGMLAVAIVQYRRRTWPILLAGLVISSALSALWMWQIEVRSPGALNTWWSAEMAQFGAVRMPLVNARTLTELLIWFAWPALPLALWSVWSNRLRLGDERIALPLILTTLLLINVAIVFPAKPVAALAVLPAMALVAVPGLLALRRGAANAFDWFSRMTFSLIASLIWLGWVAMNFDVPSKIARNFAKLAPGFSASVEPVPLMIAAAATAAWLWLILSRASPARQSSLRPLAHWASGIALIWVLTTSLWLPWIDYGKTYRSIASEIAAKTRGTSGCIAARHIGEAQFASLDYFLDHRLRATAGKRQNCNWLLAQGTQREQPVGDMWQRVWEGSRPGDKSERFRLYRRN
jgi:4-amino-4-deoxy-L-arabinose transferase-like glycosyltransferase